jgi:hypothetical protein
MTLSYSSFFFFFFFLNAAPLLSLLYFNIILRFLPTILSTSNIQIPLTTLTLHSPTMSPTTPSKTKTHSHYTSLSTPDSSPTRLPVRQKGSLTIPQLPQLPLPPLPEITNPAIRRLALTHSSNHSGQKSRKRDLIFNEHEAVLDNEKLEHVGDGLLSTSDPCPAFCLYLVFLLLLLLLLPRSCIRFSPFLPFGLTRSKARLEVRALT